MVGESTNVIQQVGNCKTEIELCSICQGFIIACGYDFFSVLKFPEEYHYSLYDITLASNWPTSLIKMYDKAGLLKTSPFAEHTKETERPFLWAAKEMYDSHTEASEETGRLLFEKANMSHGVGFRVHNADGLVGFVIFTGSKDLKNDVQFEDMQLISTHIFSKFLELQKSDAKPESRLSKREHECLLWTSEGKTSYEIGMILGLSENTINNYLVTVGRKLGAVNRPHMVGVALRNGFI